MIAIAQIQARLEAAVAALDAADYPGAVLQATGALALLAGIPNSKRKDLELDWATAKEAMEAVCAEARRQQSTAAIAAAGGVQRQKVTYASAAPSNDY
jgi:hypothetical protein